MHGSARCELSVYLVVSAGFIQLWHEFSFLMDAAELARVHHNFWFVPWPHCTVLQFVWHLNCYPVKTFSCFLLLGQRRDVGSNWNYVSKWNKSKMDLIGIEFLVLTNILDVTKHICSLQSLRITNILRMALILCLENNVKTKLSYGLSQWKRKNKNMWLSHIIS